METNTAKFINKVLKSPPNILGDRFEGHVPTLRTQKVTRDQVRHYNTMMAQVQEAMEYGAKQMSNTHISPKAQYLLANKIMAQMNISDPLLSQAIAQAPDISPQWIPKEEGDETRETILNDFFPELGLNEYAI